MKMIRKFLIGASALALGGGVVHAATNQYQTIQVGNSNTANGNQSGGTSEFAYIEQVGNKNSATTNQQGGGSGNYGWLAQRGTSNTSSITQNGTTNETDVFQGCGFRQGNSSAVNRCTGTTGGAEIPVSSNNVSVSQSGTNAFTLVDQLADGNSATVTQNGADMGRGAYTPGGNALGAVSANADIEQYHTGNFATVTQSNNSTLNTENNPDVNFSGNEGNVTILQGVRYDPATDPPGTPVTTTPPLDSPGQDNSATVTQMPGATNSHVYIAQGVSDNVATVTQSAVDEFVEIRQDGPTSNGGNNSADVTQSANDTTAFVYQNGISNMASLTQTTAGSHADIRQTGNLNHSTITQ